MAIVLPTQYAYQELAIQMDKLIEKEDYVSAMDMIGGFYDQEKAYQIEFEDNSGIIIFRAATLFDQSGVEGATQENIIQTTYSGFYYNVNDYDTNRNDDKPNSTKLVVNNLVNIDLLNYDSNDDEKLDTIVTLVDNNYFYFEVPQQLVSYIDTLEFIDKNGNSYKKIENINLDFNDKFFNDIKPFLNRYNDGLIDENKNLELDELAKNFLAKDNDYNKGGDYNPIASKKGDNKALRFIILYFIGVYVLGDCLVGKHYIIKLFRKIYIKIRYKNAPPPETEKKETYGLSHYAQLIYSLKVPDNFNGTVVIKYHNENNIIEMVFSKDNNYVIKQRIHAGVYQNAWLECNGYEAINLPKTLDISGYKMEVKVEIRKIEEKETG